MFKKILFYFSILLIFSSCYQTRIKEKKEWGVFFEKQGIKNACFELIDHTHESVYYYNLDRCSQRFTPASTFKIFNSLVALETAVAPNDLLIIKWDSIKRMPEWDKDMDMREAFKVSCVPYYQEIARRIGPGRMQHFLDTVKYGNMNMGTHIDDFWLNDSLKISVDEQLTFLKKMYFTELPFSERAQRMVKVFMLREQTPLYNLYYKTGTSIRGTKKIAWIVGFAERILNIKEEKESMNKTDQRYYPYFFSENFEIPEKDNSDDNMKEIRLTILHDILKDYGVIPK